MSGPKNLKLYERNDPMGYWNETCMLTRLPIREGDRIAALVIARRISNRNPTYADGYFAPAAQPIFGLYDGYGGIEYVENETKAENELLKSKILINVPDATGMMLRGFWIPLNENNEGTIFNALCNASRNDKLGIMHYDCRLEAKVVFIRREFYDAALTAMSTYISENDVTFPCRFTSEAVGRFNKWQHKGEMTPAECVPIARLTAFMNYCRIPYAPTCGAGSQGLVEYDFHKKFFSDIAKAAAKMR